VSLAARPASPALWLLLARRLEAYLARPADSAFGDVPEAAQLGALPLMYDIWSLLLLRPDGTLFVIDVETDEVREVPEGPERWAAIHAAARLDRDGLPELRELLPERVAGVPDCTQCGGRGFEDWLTFDGGTNAVPCGGCGSLGWLHPALPTRAG
jgi:hypothetical protein